jgi:signal transduction histidine kinase
LDNQQQNNRTDLQTRYDRLLEITSDLVSTFDLSALLQVIVEAAKELTDSEAASLLLYDPEHNHLYFESATAQLQIGDQRVVVPAEDSIAGWIFARKAPLLVEDATGDPRFFREVDLLTTFQTRSILGVPLLTKNKVLGVIEAVNKNVGTYDRNDTQMLQALAAHAAIAIENTRLFQQSDLVAEMVHELRTPLSALSAAAHLLQRKELADDQKDKLRQTIFNEVQRLDSMTTNFLELSRLESGRIRFTREPVHLEGLVLECMEILRPQAQTMKVTLQTEFDSTISPVQGDRNQLKRLLLNLVTNAIKYNIEEGSVTVSLFRDGQGVCISVRDTGKGIPEESIPHMFNRFYRVPDSEGLVSGTGLGLAIAQKIADNHGGKITVASQIGEGTTLTVWLPAGEY